jgi:hypothetical protein
VRLHGREGPPVAVYADGFGMHVSPAADRPVSVLIPAVLHFDYWMSSPPQLLLDALKQGREPDRRAAQQEGWRAQFRERLAEARREAAASPDRVLSGAATAAVSALGATFDVHSASYARVVAADGRSHVLRTDHRFWRWIERVEDDAIERTLAWFSLPATAAEPVLVAALGEAWRTARGLPAAPAPPTEIEVRLFPAHPSQWRWTDATGAEHEVKNWSTQEEAQRYAPFARWSPEQVAAHFTSPSPM